MMPDKSNIHFEFVKRVVDGKGYLETESWLLHYFRVTSYIKEKSFLSKDGYTAWLDETVDEVFFISRVEESYTYEIFYVYDDGDRNKDFLENRVKYNWRDVPIPVGFT